MTLIKTPREAMSVSRRGFLVGAGAAASTLTMGWGMFTPGAAVADVTKMISPTLFFDIHSDESVVIHIQKAEVGQHVGTALAQIVADELEADWDRVSIDYIGFDPRLGLHLTGGSWSINWTFDALSRAGASGRISLLEAAAEKFGGTAADYTARKGVITGNGHTVTYGALVASGVTPRAFTEDEMKAITLKTADQRHYVGQSLDALDIPAKATGKAMYGIDASVPGMVVATPMIPPVRNGARVISVDDSEAKSIKGYQGHMIAQGEVIDFYMQGVVLSVADTYYAAKRAAELIKVEYDAGPNTAISLADLRAENLRLIETGEAASHFLKEGDADAAISGAEKQISAIYEVGVNLHGALEPQTCLVDIQDGVYHVYTGTQIQTFMVEDLKKLGIPQENIVVHQQYLGGSFGRRQYSDPHILAAMAAKEFGKPVKVIYSREFEQVMDYSRPVNAVRLEAGLNGGKIEGMKASNAGSYLIPILAPGFMAPDATGDESRPKHDPFAVNGLDHWYTVPNQTVVTSMNAVAQGALPPGAVRAVGPGYQYFALESFIDEIAHDIGKDPLSLRLELLDGTGKNAGAGAQANGAKRLAAVLREAVNRSGYGKPMPEGHAIGIACSAPQERASAIWNACAAHVEVDRESGDFKVHKLTLVSEHGTLVNPKLTRDQLMGAGLWGLAYATLEDVQFENGVILADSFEDMSPLRQEHVPELDLTVLDSGHYPTGVGEAGATVIAPAIANAIFKAVGARVRSLPITADKVKAAIG